MAFTFDHTLSGSTSNSYVPLDTYNLGSPAVKIIGANDYFDGHPKSDLWTSLTEKQKQQLLVRATSRIDTESFGGSKTDETQRLQFPRAWLIERNQQASREIYEFTNGNYYQSSDFNPLHLDIAVFELALFYLEEWIEETPMVSRSDMSRMSSFEIGPLKAQLRKIHEDALPDTVKRSLRAIGPNGWLGGQPFKVVR